MRRLLTLLTLAMVLNGADPVLGGTVAVTPWPFAVVPASAFVELPDGTGLAAYLYDPVAYRDQDFRFRLTSGGAARVSLNGKALVGSYDDRHVLTGHFSNAALLHGANRILVAMPAGGDAGFKLEISNPGDLKFFARLPAFLDSHLHVDDYKTVTISNGEVTAELAVPDPTDGYYRGDRFEQAGLVLKLRWKGHEFFPDAGSPHDPLANNVPIGPCEEFFEPIAWDDAKVGEPFIKIGVGLFEKAVEPKMAWYNAYWPVERFPWTMHVHADSVEFVQDIRGPRGWAYRYTKRVALLPGAPVMTIEHEFVNTGTNTISAEQYNHNWVMIDGIPARDGYTATLPFKPVPVKKIPGDMTLAGDTVHVDATAVKSTEFTGFSSDPRDDDALISTDKSPARLEIGGDFPLSQVAIYSDPAGGFAFEPFFKFTVKPGETAKWTRTYRFSSVDANPPTPDK